MLITSLILFCLVGAIAGLLAGMIGIGGSIITIPCLVSIFSWMGFPKHEIMHMALATSLASMVLNTLSSCLSHISRKNVVWNIFIYFGIGSFFGAMLGPKIALDVPSTSLKLVFGMFLCALGAFLFLNARHHKEEDTKIPRKSILSLIGFAVGTVATFLGLSGGLFNVPILQSFKIQMKKAVGTSAVLNFIATLVGSLSFLVFSSSNQGSHQFGLIYLPAFYAISISTIVFAPIGAKIAHEMPSLKLKKVFSLVIFFAGIYMAVAS